MNICFSVRNFVAKKLRNNDRILCTCFTRGSSNYKDVATKKNVHTFNYLQN